MSIITETERTYLLSSMKRLLDEYDYEYTNYALNKIINEWASQKATLIEAFKKHPNYIEGQFAIVFAQDYEREITCEQADKFESWLRNILDGSCKQYLPAEAINNGPRYYIWSSPFSDATNQALGCIGFYTNRTIDDELERIFNTASPDIHAHSGEKTTRVVNRFCKWIGATNHPDYNKEYAKYADSLSPMKVTRHTVLSINPLDYLTMSFGNSWASCHTIDKQNKRDMPNSYEGQYSSGTMSYMLDEPSMVFYTVDKSYDGTEYWTQPKITRQMFHWGEEKLIQGRLYPQSNDGNSEAYTPYRQLTQEIISTCFDFPNLWKIKRGASAIRPYTITDGTHYPDYQHFDYCTLSRHEEENEECMTIGAEPICIECGHRHDTSENINCCHEDYQCEHCGCYIERGDERWIGDCVYCSDCVIYCDCCEEYVECGNTHYIRGYGDVCDDCLEDNFTWCDECNEYCHNDEMTYVESTERDVCESCLEDLYTKCAECDEYFPNDDLNLTADGRWLCDDCYEEYESEEEETEEE
jgi:hypothetical protein